MKLQFIKMHGLGNDFILLDENLIAGVALPDLARQLCLRNTGVGADGIIIMGAATDAHIRIRIFNPDGSESAMCANGIRCAAIHYYQASGYHLNNTIQLQTSVGIVPIIIHTDENTRLIATVNMGYADFSPDAIPMLNDCKHAGLSPLSYRINETDFEIHAVNIGVPHGVILVNDLDSVDIAYWGSRLETADCFPAGANINFVQVESRTSLRVRTWERGVGLVKACGSGACAALVITNTNGLTEAEATVRLQLGELLVTYTKEHSVMLSGPATPVFEGSFPY